MQKEFDSILRSLLCPSGEDGHDGTAGVLLAVSGGIDSMCLADLVLHSSLRLRFAVAHCNFHLRGEESDSDQALVEQWCRKNGARLFLADFDTASYASEKGLSIEMAARELRYRWFGSLCMEHGFSGTVVAHNSNDNVETLILNLLRGTGLKGIAGMGHVSPLPCQDAVSSGDSQFWKCLLYRPMLDFTRKQIEGYARSHGILYHEDSTNADSTYRRNRIRNEVFPLFETINPSFIKTVNREMGYFSDAAGLLEDLVRLPVSEDAARGESRIDVGSLMEKPHWPYLLYMALEPYGFNSASVSAIEKLLRSAGKSGVTLSGKIFRSASHVLVTSAKELIVRPAESGFTMEGQPDMEVPGPGTYSSGGVSFAVEMLPRNEIKDLKCPHGVLMTDSAALPFPFICRKWQPGDWMRPFGMRGRKKVSDIFTDLKFDIFSKSDAIVITSPCCSDGHVLAILGERIDDAVKIGPSTSEVTVIRLI